jgi:hypothetical protein
MTIEKFIGIILPLNKRISIYLCKRIILALLIASFIISLPIIIFTKYSGEKEISSSVRNIMTFPHTNDTVKQHSNPLFILKAQCVEIWPKNLEKFHCIYNFLLFSIQYIIPLLTIIFVYTLIASKFKKMKSIGSHITESRKRQNKKVSIFF